MKKTILLFIGMSICLWANPSWAATYYVDSQSGNDSWDGTSKTFTSGTTGPWAHLPGTVAVPGSNWAYYTNGSGRVGGAYYVGTNPGVCGNSWEVLKDGDVVYVKGDSVSKVQVVMSSQDCYQGNPRYDSIQIRGGQYIGWGSSMPIFDECGAVDNQTDSRLCSSTDVSTMTNDFGFWVGGGGRLANGITVDGFDIRNIRAGGVGEGFDGISGSANLDVGNASDLPRPTYITIRRNYLHDGIRTTDDTGHGIEGIIGFNGIIEYNRFDNVGTKGLELTGSNIIVRYNYLNRSKDHGMTLSGDHMSVYDNVVRLDPTYYVHSGVGGISLAGGSYDDVWNNIVYEEPSLTLPHNGTNGMGIKSYDNVMSNNRIFNNTMAYFRNPYDWGNGPGLMMGQDFKGLNQGTIMQNNLVYMNHDSAGGRQYSANYYLNYIQGEDVQWNDFWGGVTDEVVLAVQTSATDINGNWVQSNVKNFVAPAGHTYANNVQVAPAIAGAPNDQITGTLPTGFDSSGMHPNTNYFALTSNSPASVRATNNPFQPDSTHGYQPSNAPELVGNDNPYSVDIAGNPRTNWSMGAYEYTDSSGDVSGDGTVSAYDAALALQLGQGNLAGAQIAQKAVGLR